MQNIIFIAPPAAGKGTQSHLLKEIYGYEHISTGDMLREAVASESALWLEVKNIMDKGDLVSDDLMINLIKDKLTNIKGKPFILDGFPRTLNQALALDKLLNDSLYQVIYLKLDINEAIKRIEGRLTCSCGKTYNVFDDKLQPKQNGICDKCGRKLVKRNDDNVESFKVRYENFLTNTEKLIKYYDDKNKLHIIDVNRNVDDIFKDISKVVTND